MANPDYGVGPHAMKHALVALSLICMALGLPACGRERPQLSTEPTTVNALTANLTPRCVGRYLIDMPADAHTFQSVVVNGVKLSAEPMTIDVHRRTMQQRSEALKAAKSHFGYQYLYADQEVEGIPDAHYFVSLGSIFESPDSVRIIEAYRWSDGYQIKMEVEGSDAKNSSYFKDQPDARDASYMNNFGSRLQLVIGLLSKTRGRPDAKIPTEPGLCFQGGFLATNAGSRERVKTKFVLANHHDVNFNLNTDSSIRTDDSLLQRGADIAVALSRNDGRTLRNGPVALPGIPAEEWLMAGITVMEIPGFHFILEGNAKVGSPQSPLITLVQDVGAPNKLLELYSLERVSLTEADSIALWDKITRTLRPRPNAF